MHEKDIIRVVFSVKYGLHCRTNCIGQRRESRRNPLGDGKKMVRDVTGVVTAGGAHVSERASWRPSSCRPLPHWLWRGPPPFEENAPPPRSGFWPFGLGLSPFFEASILD